MNMNYEPPRPVIRDPQPNHWPLVVHVRGNADGADFQVIVDGRDVSDDPEFVVYFLDDTPGQDRPIESHEHWYGMGAVCCECPHVMTVAECLASLPDEVPNRTWYEVYWVGPRELHASCDPFGTALRGVSMEGCPIGECGE